MAKYNKLVRDGIPEHLDNKGLSYTKRVATDEEFQKELIKKLLEEATEFSVDGDIEELADILEVIESLRGLPDYREVEDIKIFKKGIKKKKKKRFIVSGDDKDS